MSSFAFMCILIIIIPVITHNKFLTTALSNISSSSISINHEIYKNINQTYDYYKKNFTCDDVSLTSMDDHLNERITDKDQNSFSSLPSKTNQNHLIYDQEINNDDSSDWLVQQKNHHSRFMMNEKYLRGSSILFGLTQWANKQNVSKKCYKQLKEIEKAVLRRDIWAMKVLDSSGSKESGFLWGHNYWLGSKEGCEAVQNPISITFSDQYERAMKQGLINDLAPFQMEYRVIYVKHNSPWQIEIKFMGETERIIHIGLCLPKTCSTPEVYNMTQKFLEQGFFEEGNMYDLHAKVIHVKDLKLNENFLNKTSVKIIVVFFIFTISMVICSSCLSDQFTNQNDYKQQQQKNKSNLNASIIENDYNENNNNKIANRNVIDSNVILSKNDLNCVIKNKESISNTLSPIVTQNKSNIETTAVESRQTTDPRDPLTWYPHPNVPPVTQKVSFFQSILKCFNIVENCKNLFTLRDLDANSIPAINGLRSISCVWILLFHVIWYMYFTVDNRTFLISYGERASFQYISTAPLLVDVFFTISGFLTAYNFIKNESNLITIRTNSFTQNAGTFGKMILHRYLRLAPSYLVLIGLVEIFTTYTEDVSLFHIHERYDKTCSKYWWRNLIFIQNLFHQDELCLNWTWSLACEMQFYFVSLILLFIYAKQPNKAKTIFIIKLFSSILWTLFVGYRFQYKFSFDVVYNTGTQIYINPFVRVMPYLIGIGSGWYMAMSKGNFQINEKLEKTIWNITIIIFFACIYSLYIRDLSFSGVITLLIGGRITFSLAVIWMIIGSATGRGVWWSRFLEWKFFQHLNKLSYSIYLLNPFIIAMVFSLSNTSTHADPLLLGVLTIGFIVIAYICAIVFYLLFEIPYCNLSTNLLRQKPQIKKL